MGGALVLHCRCPLAAPAFHHLCVLVGGLQLLLGIMGYLHSPPLLLLGIVGDLHSPSLPIGNGSREIFISAAHFGGFCFFGHSSISHSWFQDVSSMGATPLPLTFVEAPTVTLHPSFLVPAGMSWVVWHFPPCLYWVSSYSIYCYTDPTLSATATVPVSAPLPAPVVGAVWYWRIWKTCFIKIIFVWITL
jgi:hypothetical protein